MANIKEFYDTHSLKYEEFERQALTNKEKFPLLYNIRHKERDLLRKGANKKVFYFATGSGSDVAHLVKLYAKVFTFDYSIEMINRTIARLENEGIEFKLLKNPSDFTTNYIENFFEQDNIKVLILLAAIEEVELPKNYFDYTFCYCTLPLLGKQAIKVLRKLLTSSKNGIISVYDKEKLPFLHKYYADFGFKSEVIDRTITIEGGFEYYCIPSSDVIKTIKEEKKLDVVEIGLGKIYNWTEK